MLVEDFAATRKNTLRGFLKITLPSGMLLHDAAIHVSNEQAWAAAPSKPMLDCEGHALRDADNKIRYAPVVAFATKELRDKFSRSVVDAVRLAHPEALEP
jgi:hypothetical protein